jgi:hypothetical protein
MLKGLLCYISLAFFALPAIAEVEKTPPSFSLYMEKFCASRPYDCTDNKIITPHLLNTFLYEFYLEVETFFSYQGFEKAEFEYCASTDCLEEGVSVKNSKYKITQIFPRKREYYRAFGGVNRNSGVHFSKALTEEEANSWCSIQVRAGNNLSSRARRAIQKGEMSLWNLKTKHYKKYSLAYVRYLPQINALDHKSDTTEDQCWLRYKNNKIIFELKETSR